MGTKYVCPLCEGENVEHALAVWVDPNTGEHGDYAGYDPDVHYCNDCASDISHFDTVEVIETEDEWEDHYKPVPNADGVIAPLEWEEIPVNIRSDQWQYIWTLVECDDDMAIVSGVHYVNRLGYYYTEVPWTDDLVIDIPRERDPWDEDPGWPVADWQLEVANDDTRLGYWDWVKNQEEMSDD